MKRPMTLLAVAASLLLVASAVPAAAKGKPPKSQAALEVSMGAVPVWAHEGADLLRYTVTLENKTDAPITDVTIEFTAATTTDTEAGVTIPANDIVTLGFSRFAWEFPESDPCLPADPNPLSYLDEECELPASVAVYDVTGEWTIDQTLATPFYPDPPCFFENGVATVDGICIWTLPTPNTGANDGPGVWRITLTPTPPTNNPKKPISATVSVRDGVPGNWCSLAVGTPSGFGGQWRAGDPDPYGDVYLPGAEDLPGDDPRPEEHVGMCLNGGAGGDYFAVGNPSSFYLSADGLVTVAWVKALPSDPDPPSGP